MKPRKDRGTLKDSEDMEAGTHSLPILEGTQGHPSKCLDVSPIKAARAYSGASRSLQSLLSSAPSTPTQFHQMHRVPEE